MNCASSTPLSPAALAAICSAASASLLLLNNVTPSSSSGNFGNIDEILSFNDDVGCAA